MDFGIDTSDTYGVAALFLAQSMANQFSCHDQIANLLAASHLIQTPLCPSGDLEVTLEPIDQLLDVIRPEPGSIELVEALVRLGADTPPATVRTQHLFRALVWVLMRHDASLATPIVLRIMREATPGSRPRGTEWPGHEFFASVLVLVLLGGVAARVELRELLLAAQDLGYDDLAPILEWFIDDPHSASTS